MNKIELTKQTGVQLAAIYNALSSIPVTKFADKAAAVRRVQGKLDAAKSVVVDALPETVNPDTTIHLLNHGLEIISQADYDAARAAAPRPNAGRPTGRAVFGEDEVIEVNTPWVKSETGPDYHQNPKRAGSKAHARFQIICDQVSMTVGEYLDACVALEGDSAQERYKYRIDLTWNIEHGFITFPNGAE